LKEFEETRKPIDLQLKEREEKSRIWYSIVGIIWIIAYKINSMKDNEKVNPFDELFLEYITPICLAIYTFHHLQVQKLESERLCKLWALIFEHNQSFLPKGLRWYLSDEKGSSIHLYKEYQIQVYDDEEWDPSGTVVVFCYDSLRKMFNSDFYSPELTNGRVSRAETKQALSEVSSLRKIQELIGIIHPLLLPAFLILYVVSFSFVIKCEMTPNQAAFLLGILGIVNGILTLGLYMWLPKYLSSRYKTTIENLNQRFSSRGLKWQIPNYIKSIQWVQWVELVKEYQIRNLVRGNDEYIELM